MRAVAAIILWGVATVSLGAAQAQSPTVTSAPEPVEVARPSSDRVAQALDWLRDAYEREPQLMTASVLMVLGLMSLSLIALLYVGIRRGVALARRRWQTAAKAVPQTNPSLQNAAPKRVIPALEIVDDGATALPVRGAMIRIGRHEENDICLSSKSVHRYHAVMQLTEEHTYIITDISGLDGNGVFVNAERIDNATLQNGDLIELGDVKLRFRLNELH